MVLGPSCGWWRITTRMVLFSIISTARRSTQTPWFGWRIRLLRDYLICIWRFWARKVRVLCLLSRFTLSLMSYWILKCCHLFLCWACRKAGDRAQGSQVEEYPRQIECHLCHWWFGSCCSIRCYVGHGRYSLESPGWHEALHGPRGTKILIICFVNIRMDLLQCWLLI